MSAAHRGATRSGDTARDLLRREAPRRSFPTLMVILAAAAVVATVLAGYGQPSSRDWQVIGILAVVAVADVVLGRVLVRPQAGGSPPWDVHSIWLVPAALLTTPPAFAVLVALSLVFTLSRRSVPLRWRIVVGSITVLTALALHAVAGLFGDLLIGGLVGIAVHWAIGALTAYAAAALMGTAGDTALWIDTRWTYVELGCTFSGLLLAVAMRDTVLLGLLGIPLALFASFALRWPELTRSARVDAKTGLPNARHWEERTRELLAGAAHRGWPCAVMMIDLDHFKQVNDAHGHLAGDQVLIAVARTIRDALPAADLLGRFGGEEFSVTAIGVDRRTAATMAQRIRAAVATVPHTVTDVRGHRVVLSPITCTIGLACSVTSRHDATALLRQADLALAHGKQNGRNQVYVSGQGVLR